MGEKIGLAYKLIIIRKIQTPSFILYNEYGWKFHKEKNDLNNLLKRVFAYWSSCNNDANCFASTHEMILDANNFIPI